MFTAAVAEKRKVNCATLCCRLDLRCIAAQSRPPPCPQQLQSHQLDPPLARNIYNESTEAIHSTHGSTGKWWPLQNTSASVLAPPAPLLNAAVRRAGRTSRTKHSTRNLRSFRPPRSGQVFDPSHSPVRSHLSRMARACRRCIPSALPSSSASVGDGRANVVPEPMPSDAVVLEGYGLDVDETDVETPGGDDDEEKDEFDDVAEFYGKRYVLLDKETFAVLHSVAEAQDDFAYLPEVVCFSYFKPTTTDWSPTSSSDATSEDPGYDPPVSCYHRRVFIGRRLNYRCKVVAHVTLVIDSDKGLINLVTKSDYGDEDSDDAFDGDNGVDVKPSAQAENCDGSGRCTERWEDAEDE